MRGVPRACCNCLSRCGGDLYRAFGTGTSVIPLGVEMGGRGGVLHRGCGTGPSMIPLCVVVGMSSLQGAGAGIGLVLLEI